MDVGERRRTSGLMLPPPPPMRTPPPAALGAARGGEGEDVELEALAALMLPPPPLPTTPQVVLAMRSAGKGTAGARAARGASSSAASRPAIAQPCRYSRLASSEQSGDDDPSPFAPRPPSVTPRVAASSSSAAVRGGENQPLTDAPPAATPAVTPGAQTPRTPASQAIRGAGRQDPATVARIHELGLAGASVVEIDRVLHREGFRTSTGTRWPAKNDGRVVVRLLLNNGITPSAGDAKVAKYIAEYSSKLSTSSHKAHGSGK